MKRCSGCLVLLVFINSAFASTAGDEMPRQAEPGSQTVIEARARLAESGTFRFRNDTRGLTESTQVDPESVPVSGGRVIDATFTGHPAMLGSLDPDRTLRSPVDTPLFAISTGQAVSSRPAPGSSFGSRGDMPDRARLRLTLEPEEGRFLLFVTWNLFTAEIPAFSRLGFDDVFSVHVVDASGRRTLVEITASDDRMYPVSNSRAAGSGFDLYAHNPAILPAEYGPGKPAAWMSGWHTTGFAIDSSGPIELEIEVRDAVDGLMDTQVLIEHIRFSALIPAPLAEGGQAERGSEDCVSFGKYCEALFPQPGTFAGTGNPQAPPRICEFGVEGRMQTLDLGQPNEFRGHSCKA